MTTQIRRIEPDELTTVSAPLQTYAFFPSPPRKSDGTPMADLAPYLSGNLTLGIVEDGVSVAEVAAIPLRQNVRGLICAMAGFSAAASHPLVRRQGHMRELVIEVLHQMCDMGCTVGGGYPFRPSFWQRFGCIGLPKIRTATLTPAGLSPLLNVDLPAEITVEPIADGYQTYRSYLHRILDERHGFAVMPEFRAVRLRDINDRWLATVRENGEVTGVMLYRINGFNADLPVDVMLTSNSLARTVLLRYLAQHVEQIAQITLPLAPHDFPELWSTDMEITIEAKITLPGTPSAVARVLSLPGMTGMAVGPGRVTIRVVDDEFIGGDHCLDGTSGKLEVSPGIGEPDATLTAPGLSGLIYGVLDPDEVVFRGFGSVTPAAAATLRSMFPKHIPHLTVTF